MLRPALALVGLWGICVLTGTSLAQAGGEGGGPGLQLPVDRVASMQQFKATHPRNDFMFLGNRIDRVYGPAFANGDSPQQSAEKFRLGSAGLWGITPADLIPVAHYAGGQHVQPMMYDAATGLYKFTGLNYTQVRDGVPVFRGRLTLLVRNEPGYPLVLASADLRDLGAFHVTPQQAGKPNILAGRAVIGQTVGKDAVIEAGQTVIWAGVDATLAPPTLAVQYIAQGGDVALGTYHKTLFLAEAASGAILYQENQIREVNVTGNVSGMATQNWGADVCDPEASTPLPYARVSIGATEVFADVSGNFNIPNAGSSQVTVNSIISGQYFVVNDYNASSVASPPITLSQNVNPPGPVNFLHNSANTDEFNRAEVNAYLHANVVHDFVLDQNPAYPTIAGQTGFPVNVDINLTCNAFYDGTSINFYKAGPTCSNTANSTVVHHEYGHHVVESGGSGQGAYGEGMGDVMGVLISDQPCLGNGFNQCGSCLRNADNTCQYQPANCSSCGSASHDCGKLISGCVWSTRNKLQATNPSTYLDILRPIAVNAVLVHSGSTITPSITVDYLTLDDDDDDINNGTPHYTEINNGFTDHNMPGPALPALFISYPNGRPAFVSPSGGTVMNVVVTGNTSSPQAGTGKFYVNTGSGFLQSTMNQVSPNVYQAVFPSSTCGNEVKYYVTATAINSSVVTSPSTAPTGFFTAISSSGLGPVVFNDNFQSDQGWTTTNNALDGAWERGDPLPDAFCDRGNPPVDADGSGLCYLTNNSTVTCNSDVDDGSVILTSPNMNTTGGPGVLSYWRWYSNTQGASPQADTFVIEFSINGGSTWLPLETVGPTVASPNPEVDGGWFQKTFSLNTLPGYSPTTQFKVRFNASDLGNGSVVEAGIDGVKLQTLVCAPVCIGNVNGDNVVNVDDLLGVIGSWGACQACPADVVPNGVVNVDDLLAVINHWGPCP